MWKTLLGERGIRFRWNHEGRKSYGGNTILEGDVLAPILQDSALDQEKILSIHSVVGALA